MELAIRSSSFFREWVNPNSRAVAYLPPHRASIGGDETLLFRKAHDSPVVTKSTPRSTHSRKSRENVHHAIPRRLQLSVTSTVLICAESLTTAPPPPARSPRTAILSFALLLPPSTSTARTAMANTAPGRRQSTRQVRTSANRPQNYYARNFAARGVNNGDPGSSSDAQPGFYPAITHFTDAVDALPREVVRHFTMLKEVEAKLHAPDHELRRLADSISQLPTPPRANVLTQPHFPGLSARNSINGSRNGSIGGQTPLHHLPASTQHSDRPTQPEDPEADRERQNLFYHLWVNIKTIDPIMDEKIAVLSTANQKLARQLERMQSSYVHIPEELSDIARLGDPKHWAYVTEKETKKTAPERTRRDVANANTLAAAAAAASAADDGEAAMRSNARREAVAARKQRAQQVDSDFDDRPVPRKGPGKGRKAVDDGKQVGLGITNGAGGVKRRKVAAGAAPMERSLSSAMASALRGGQGSPRETPEVVKKRAKPGPIPRKKYVVVSGRIIAGTDSKHRAAIGAQSPRLVSSPIVGTFSKEASARPQTSRGRQNSTAASVQSAALDTARNRPSSPPSNKATNGSSSTGLNAVEQLQASTTVDTLEEHVPIALKPLPEQLSSLKSEDVEVVDDITMADPEPPAPAPVVTTRAGRTSKTATPLASTFPPEIQLGPRIRVPRNKDLSGGSHASSESGERVKRKRGAGSVATSTKADTEVPTDPLSDADVEADAEDADIEGGDPDAVEEESNEPKYCYCDDVSYGEMVACDNESCSREWFHLKCAGLSKAPDENSMSESFVFLRGQELISATVKWYCDECKVSMREPKRSRPASRRE
jgi:hypothetical protein